MDTKIEGYLVAAIALIPTGISIIMTNIDLTTKMFGTLLVGLGLVAVYLRGLQKDNV